MTLRGYGEVWWTGLALAATGVLLLYVGTGGWPGAIHECVALGTCYCEAPRPGLIAQPANTVSCLGWAVAGLWIAWDAGRRRKRNSAPDSELHPFASWFYTGLYALVVVGLVPGGVFFHASLTDWGGKLDILSMYLLVDFWIFYNLARAFRWSKTAFVTAYLAATTVLLIPRVVYSAVEIGLLIFGGLIVLGLLVEVRIARRHSLRWVGIGLGGFGLAHLVQAALPCDPDSLLQPHAALHLIETVSLLAFYMHFFVASDSQMAAGTQAN